MLRKLVILKADGSLESLGKNEKSIWEYYNEIAAVEDNIREGEWRDLADTILVFVRMSNLYNPSLLICLQDGLFAAFLSAFLVFTIPQLQPNSTDGTMDVLIHISQQLSNSTTPAYSPPEFVVPPSIVAVNVLFFLSLALVLMDAFLAMLVKGWLQEFDRSWRQHTVARLRAHEREQRFQGLQRWKLADLVALLPFLIQTSLLFFCIGLIVLLFPIHLISAILSSIALVAGFTFYAFTTYVSVIDDYAPFSSPVSRGLRTLREALRAAWPAAWRTAWRTAWRPPQGRQAEKEPSIHLLPGNNDDAPSNDTSEKREEPRSPVDILERLVTTTAEGVENIPVFLELLDQPVKDPTLRPSNIERWERLFDITLMLLGDPSTFSGSAARTISRSVLFCCKTENQQLSQRLIKILGQKESRQAGEQEPLNPLFTLYLGYHCGFTDDHGPLSCTIASLGPINAADEELLWMVNTVHTNSIWKKNPMSVYERSLEFFAAVLTYVSSTEQSKRSQVPLTAAVIYAMHTIKSALEGDGFKSIQCRHILPGAPPTAESKLMAFHQVDALKLWSGPCVERAEALLRPHTYWSGPNAHLVRQFQLPLIAALYIDSTEHLDHASAKFAEMLKLTSIPDITISAWGWDCAYDQTKLAGYWYMANFRQPLYTNNSSFQDVGCVIIQTIQESSEIELPALCLLDTSVKHLCATASSISLTKNALAHLELRCTLPSGAIEYATDRPAEPWIVFHLSTLFAQSSIFPSEELEILKWADTPERIHIAKARLNLYDCLQSEGHKETKQPMPYSQVLEMFLSSKDYSVCTGAFKCWLNLVTTSEPSSSGNAQSPEYSWIKNLIQVVCGSVENRIRSWELLAEHLVPKWSILPSCWCNDFALAFLVSEVHPPGLHELPAYQYLAEGLKGDQKIDQLQSFLSFLATILEPMKLGWTMAQLFLLNNWLAQLPNVPGREDMHALVETILAKIVMEQDH